MWLAVIYCLAIDKEGVTLWKAHGKKWICKMLRISCNEELCYKNRKEGGMVCVMRIGRDGLAANQLLQDGENSEGFMKFTITCTSRRAAIFAFGNKIIKTSI